MRRPLKPTRVFIQVTDRCLAGCAHCGFDCKPTDSGRIAPAEVEAFLGAFERRFGRPSHLALTGGEPMLEPGLTCELARLAAGRGILVRLVTNASWALTPHMAAKGIESLTRAGVTGLWVSAGAYHDKAIPVQHTRNLLAAAGDLNLPAFLNFTYLRPLSLGMRGKGLVGVDERIGPDRDTARSQARWAERLPAGAHGWARIWDTGRARALIDGLGPGLAKTLRRELRQAEAGGGEMDDLLGLGLGGEVFAGESSVGRVRGGRYAAALSALAR